MSSCEGGGDLAADRKDRGPGWAVSAGGLPGRPEGITWPLAPAHLCGPQGAECRGRCLRGVGAPQCGLQGDGPGGEMTHLRTR